MSTATERDRSMITREAMRHDAHLFAEFDLDSSASLDFDEFLAMQPALVRLHFTTEQIRQNFDLADLDGNGCEHPADALALTVHESTWSNRPASVCLWLVRARTHACQSNVPTRVRLPTRRSVLSINEYFKWSLSNASRQYGTEALAATFRRYDKDGSGVLDGVRTSPAALKPAWRLAAPCLCGRHLRGAAHIHSRPRAAACRPSCPLHS